MTLRHAALAGLSAILLLASCKKDKDDTPPTVVIIEPAAGTTISIPDTLNIRVQVSDEHVVRSLTVELSNAANTIVASAGTRDLNNSAGTYTFSLPLTNERLPSGTYTIVARASDGTNDGRGFLRLNVLEAPLRLRAIFLAPPFSTNTTTITHIDSLGQPSTFATVQDFNGIAVDSYSQHLFVAGSQYAPFHAFPTALAANGWQVPSPTNDQPEQFTAVTVDPLDRRLYFATRDGFIRGFTGEGAQQFTAQCLPDHRCEAIVVLETEVATWQRAIVGGASRIVTYTVAGTIYEQLPVEHDRVALFHRSGTSLIHFANANGSGLIEHINITDGGTPDIHTFNGEMIRAVVRLDTHRYIIALTDRLIRWDHQAQQATPLTTGITTDAMAYEAATGALYIAEGSTLITLDPNSGAIVNSLPTGSAIGHILPLLNR